MMFRQFHPEAVLPTQKNFGDAGYDLHSLVSGTILPKTVVKIRTGVGSWIDYGKVGLIRDRSSSSWKENDGQIVHRGIIICGGVVDSGYCGEIFVTLSNTGDCPFHFKAGQAIAQLIILWCQQRTSRWCDPVLWEERIELSQRKEQGYGSTDQPQWGDQPHRNPCGEIPLTKASIAWHAPDGRSPEQHAKLMEDMQLVNETSPIPLDHYCQVKKSLGLDPTKTLVDQGIWPGDPRYEAYLLKIRPKA